MKPEKPDAEEALAHLTEVQVGNLPDGCTEWELRQKVEEFGPVSICEISSFTARVVSTV